MEKTHFESTAGQMLEDLAELLDFADADGDLEVEYTDGVLTITLPDTKQYVINRHRVTEQLWWSSPLSGAKYFTLSVENTWLDKDNNELKPLLLAELQILASIEVM